MIELSSAIGTHLLTALISGIFGYKFRILSDKRKEFNEATEEIRNIIHNNHEIKHAHIVQVKSKIGKRAKPIEKEFENYCKKLKEIDELGTKDEVFGEIIIPDHHKEQARNIRREANKKFLKVCEAK